jgi:hypothetical protein
VEVGEEAVEVDCLCRGYLLMKLQRTRQQRVSEGSHRRPPNRGPVKALVKAMMSKHSS